MPPPIGSSGAKNSLHMRFIPREELDSFAAWQPGDLAGAGASPTASPGTATGAPAVDPAGTVAEQLHLARQSGYQDGYRDGLVALEGFKQSFAHQTTLQVGTLIQSLGTQIDAMQQEMAEALIATALGLARQVVRSELGAQPDTVALVAREAIDTLLLNARHITLRAHPDDQALIAGGAADVIAARGVRLLADASVARGGCVVESNVGIVDAGIETRWRRAVAALGSEASWHSDEAAPAEPTP